MAQGDPEKQAQVTMAIAERLEVAGKQLQQKQAIRQEQERIEEEQRQREHHAVRQLTWMRQWRSASQGLQRRRNALAHATTGLRATIEFACACPPWFPGTNFFCFVGGGPDLYPTAASPEGVFGAAATLPKCFRGRQ